MQAKRRRTQRRIHDATGDRSKPGVDVHELRTMLAAASTLSQLQTLLRAIARISRANSAIVGELADLELDVFRQARDLTRHQPEVAIQLISGSLLSRCLRPKGRSPGD